MEKPPSPKRKLSALEQEDLSLVPFTPRVIWERPIRCCRSDDACILCEDTDTRAPKDFLGFDNIEAPPPPPEKKKLEDRDEDPNAEFRDEEEQELAERYLEQDQDCIVESVRRSLYSGEISVNVRHRSPRKEKIDTRVFVTAKQLENPSPVTRWASDSDAPIRPAAKPLEDMPIRRDWLHNAEGISVLDNVGLQDYGCGFTMPLPVHSQLPFDDELFARTLVEEVLPRRISVAAEKICGSTKAEQNLYFWHRRRPTAEESERYFKQVYTRDLETLSGYCVHFMFYKYGKNSLGEQLYFAETLMPPDKGVMMEARKRGTLAASKDALKRLAERSWEQGGEHTLDPEEEHSRLCGIVAPLITLRYTTPVMTLAEIRSFALEARVNCAYCRCLCVQLCCPICQKTTKAFPNAPDATPYYLVDYSCRAEHEKTRR